MRLIRTAMLLIAASLTLTPASAPAFPLRGPLARAIFHSSVACDPAGTAAIAAMTTPPDAKHKQAYCTLISALETSGVWAKLDYLLLGASHSPQSSRLNLVNPAVTCSETGGGAITYTTDVSMAGDGTRYISCSPLAPSGAHYQQDSASAGAFYGDLNVSGTRMGADNSNLSVRHSTAAPNVVSVRLNGAVTTSLTAGASTTGWRHALVTRSSSAGITAYSHNAPSDFPQSTTVSSDPSTTSPAASTLYVFRAGATTSGAGTSVKAVYTGGAMTFSDEEAMHTALVAYLSTIGAI